MWAFRMVLVSYIREARVRRVQLLKRDLLRCCLAHSRASRAPTSADALFRMIVWRFAYGLRYARPLVGMSYLKLCVDEPRAPRAVGQRQQQQEKLNMAHTIAHVTTSACLTCSYSGKKACNHADFNMIAGFLRSVTNQSEAASSNRLV